MANYCPTFTTTLLHSTVFLLHFHCISPKVLIFFFISHAFPLLFPVAPVNFILCFFFRYHIVTLYFYCISSVFPLHFHCIFPIPSLPFLIISPIQNLYKFYISTSYPLFPHICHAFPFYLPCISTVFPPPSISILYFPGISPAFLLYFLYLPSICPVITLIPIWTHLTYLDQS